MKPGNNGGASGSVDISAIRSHLTDIATEEMLFACGIGRLSRRLRPAVRLRRSSDGAEKDWKPDNNGMLDGAAIDSWTGQEAAVELLVLYDQSGSSFDFTPASEESVFLLPHSGTDYVYIPNTASEKLEVANPTGGANTVDYEIEYQHKATELGSTSDDPIQLLGGNEGRLTKVTIYEAGTTTILARYDAKASTSRSVNVNGSQAGYTDFWGNDWGLPQVQSSACPVDGPTVYLKNDLLELAHDNQLNKNVFSFFMSGRALEDGSLFAAKRNRYNGYPGWMIQRSVGGFGGGHSINQEDSDGNQTSFDVRRKRELVSTLAVSYTGRGGAVEGRRIGRRGRDEINSGGQPPGSLYNTEPITIGGTSGVGFQNSLSVSFIGMSTDVDGARNFNSVELSQFDLDSGVRGRDVTLLAMIGAKTQWMPSLYGWKGKRTILGTSDNRIGPMVWSYDHKGKSLRRRYLTERGGVRDHGHPQPYVIDGELFFGVSGHNADYLEIWKAPSIDARLVTKLSNVPNGSNSLTYNWPEVFPDGRIRTTWRGNGNERWYADSTDKGQTWGSPVSFISNGSDRPYLRSLVDPTFDRVHYFYSDGNPDDGNSLGWLFHVYWEGGSYFLSDGTHLKDETDLPLKPGSGDREGTVIWDRDAQGEQTRSHDAFIDGNGNIYVLHATAPDPQTTKYYLAE